MKKLFITDPTFKQSHPDRSGGIPRGCEKPHSWQIPRQARNDNITKLVVILLCSLFFLSKADSASAFSEFNCTLNPSTGKCETVTPRECDPGSEEKFPDNSTCEGKSTQACPVGPQPCKPKEGLTCTPNSKFCDGDVLKTCNSTGTGTTGPTVNCSATGKTCKVSGVAYCGDATTPPLPGGNNGGGGGTTGGEEPSIVDLNQIIKGMGGNIAKFKTLGDIISKALPIFYAIAGTGLLLYLIYGGFGYLTSAGDPKKMEAAKGVLTTAIIGFVIVIVAFWVTQIVNFVFGLGTKIQ